MRSSPASNAKTNHKKLILGIFVLLLVDIIWVSSSQLTNFIYVEKEYKKPFFTTYIKTSMFMIYLIGFIFWKPWKSQCSSCHNSYQHHPHCMSLVNENNSEDSIIDNLSPPLYVPLKYDSDKDSLGSRSSSIGDLSEQEDHEVKKKANRVRFKNTIEVRTMSELEAEAASYARLSYNVSVQSRQTVLRSITKLPYWHVFRIALTFSFLWFFANFSYQEAIADEGAISLVNILSTMSGLFTLILAAFFPSSHGDRFTLSKFIAVLLSIGGTVLIGFSKTQGDGSSPQLLIGSAWALLGAILYACYLVTLKRRVDNEEKLDIPMFFGFVGLIVFVLMWPGLYILHYTKLELFELPSQSAWALLLVNGLIGTVLSEYLWLWGCFLTSSLIGTLSLSLTIPLSILADIFMNKVVFNWMFFLGTVPVFVSFFAVSFLSYYNDWDPALEALANLVCCLCRGCGLCSLFSGPAWTPEDREQTETLLRA